MCMANVCKLKKTLQSQGGMLIGCMANKEMRGLTMHRKGIEEARRKVVILFYRNTMHGSWEKRGCCMVFITNLELAMQDRRRGGN